MIRQLQVRGEGTIVTACCAAAMCLADRDGKCMELIEEDCKIFWRIFGERLPCELRQHLVALFTCGNVDQLVALDDTSHVFIGYRNRMMEGIEQNRVSGFISHAGKG